MHPSSVRPCPAGLRRFALDQGDRRGGEHGEPHVKEPRAAQRSPVTRPQLLEQPSCSSVSLSCGVFLAGRRSVAGGCEEDLSDPGATPRLAGQIRAKAGNLDAFYYAPTPSTPNIS